MLRLVFNLTVVLTACFLLAQGVSRGFGPLPEGTGSVAPTVPEPGSETTPTPDRFRPAGTDDAVLVYQIGSECDDGTQYTSCGVGTCGVACGDPYYWDMGTSGSSARNYVGFQEYGSWPGESMDTALRFELTDVDQGDKFVYARLIMPGLSSGTWTSPLDINIVGIDEDSVPSFCVQPPWEGAGTDNEVSWTLTSNWPSNSDRDCTPLRRYTPDISSIVNEIVGRDRWGRNGKYLGLILEDATTACVANFVKLEDYRASTDGDCPDAIIAPKIELYPTVRSTFLGKEMLGRPTAHTVTVNAYSLLPMAIYFEYKAQEDCSTVGCSGQSCHQTIVTTHSAEQPIEVVLGDVDCSTEGLACASNGLLANTHYCYRMNYRPAGGGAFEAGPWHSFHTQRSPGSEFVFTIQSDSHLQGMLRRNNEENLEFYRCVLKDTLEQAPDFHIDLGDTFHSESHTGRDAVDADETLDRHLDQRPFLDLLCHSAPFLFVLGNHEGEQGWRIEDSDHHLAEWAASARMMIYPNPPDAATNGFYTGNKTHENYYSWDWGNARFIVLDVFRYTTTQPYGAQGSQDSWDWTLGKDQYMWLQGLLEDQNKPRYTFVLAHHVTGGVFSPGRGSYGRGGAEAALHHQDFYPGSYEWGGANSNGTWGLDAHRSDWDLSTQGLIPVHDLMAENDTTIFFHGHDHVFALQYVKRSASTNGFGTHGLSTNGVIYQECPQPSKAAGGDGFHEQGLYYHSGHALNNSGYLKVTVSSNGVEVDYIRITVEETSSNGYTCGDPEVAYSYAAACAGPCGACCLPDGSCDRTLPVEDCNEAGGVCRGCDATCATAGCSLPALDEASASGRSCLHHCSGKPSCEASSNEYCLSLDVGTVGVSVEPRFTTGLSFELDLDGTTKELVTATITCDPSDKIFVVPTEIEEASTDTVIFEPGSVLPDENCCRIELSGGAIGWLDFQTLVGDVNRDGSVSTADLSSVKARLGQTVSPSNFRCDVNADGSISTADRSSVKQRLENVAADCP